MDGTLDSSLKKSMRVDPTVAVRDQPHLLPLYNPRMRSADNVARKGRVGFMHLLIFAWLDCRSAA
jgi:hypothetical protein